jgi:hypothetical protein
MVAQPGWGIWSSRWPPSNRYEVKPADLGEAMTSKWLAWMPSKRACENQQNSHHSTSAATPWSSNATARVTFQVRR